jgi:glycerophosphoryl diester phosphodiesterase
MRRALLCALLCALSTSAVLIPAASATAANRWIQKDAPLNIAHQGGEDEFPSNTMYAFRKALRAGADMLELDIGVTRDGKVVVIHDTTVDSKTNGHGTIASKTLRQIRRLDAAFWFAPRADQHRDQGTHAR